MNGRVKGISRPHAARGMLPSGATLIAAIEVMEEETSKHITACIDRVKAVAMDAEAFAMMNESFEISLAFLSNKLDGVYITATGGRFDASDIGRRKAALALFAEARDRLRRQLELHRFTFSVPHKPVSTPYVDTSNADPAKPKGGKPLAAHWDEMWAAIAVALHVGDLQPKTQADLERAMKDWLVAKGINAADSSVRQRAQHLWRKLQESE